MLTRPRASVLASRRACKTTVGIGKSIAHEKLETIAGDGSIATASDFDDLDNQLDDIMKNLAVRC